MKYDIPFAKPSITEREIKYATDAATSGWGKRCYEYINNLERKFATYLDVPYCIATSSCTGALHIALRAIGILPGDEVIVPAITWIGSVAPITYEKAIPVFVDIDPITWCIDIEEIEGVITPKTKAIVAVHLYGNLCNMSKLREIANRHSLYLIEDAAEALGSMWNNKAAGSIGDIGVFSFHGTKTMTTGEGGMLAIKSEEIFEKALIQSNHGRKASRHSNFWMDEVGVKYKMSNIQAAIGCGQLERINELVERKREIFEYYKKKLESLPVVMNTEGIDEYNSYWLPAVVATDVLMEKRRDEIVAKANAMGIGLRPFFYPLSRFPMFDKYSQLRNSTIVSRSGFNLPSFHDISRVELDSVIEYVRESIAETIN
jgi:perosamine synthetase